MLFCVIFIWLKYHFVEFCSCWNVVLSNFALVEMPFCWILLLLKCRFVEFCSCWNVVLLKFFDVYLSLVIVALVDLSLCWNVVWWCVVEPFKSYLIYLTHFYTFQGTKFRWLGRRKLSRSVRIWSTALWIQNLGRVCQDRSSGGRKLQSV